jgi:hypothetical protein
MHNDQREQIITIQGEVTRTLEYSHIKPEQISYSPSPSPLIFLFVNMLYGVERQKKGSVNLIRMALKVFSHSRYNINDVN